MKTVIDSFENEIVIQKSRFIGIIRPLKNKEDVKIILADIQKNILKQLIIAMDIFFKASKNQMMMVSLLVRLVDQFLKL